jgi:peptidoglycan/LPS O-acetylase OafA/YrhL
MAGLCILCYSYANIRGDAFYPSYWGLYVTIGTGLLIRKNSGFINEWILGNRLCIFIGKISYSAYLFHFPMIVLSNCFGNRLYNLKLAFVASVIVTYVIENRVRKSNWVFTVPILCSIVLILLVLCILAYRDPAEWSKRFK